MRFDAASILPVVMDWVDDQLANPDLLKVTQNEYEIMCSPEGELYDKTIIEK